MKVKRLIELLSELPQNAEVVVWNGFVQDVMPIKAQIGPCVLTRPSASQRAQWEINPYVGPEDISSGLYRSKRVFVIQGMPTGKYSPDRFGGLRY